jgi:chorismate mutase/prephenate dehydratase
MRPSRKSKPPALAALRKQIDALDEQILALLNRRMEVVRQIGRVKSQSSGHVLDAARERQILDRLRSLNAGPLSEDDVCAIFGEVMSAARRLQRPCSASYFGPEATFTHLAALKYFGRSTHLLPLPGIVDVFGAVERGRTDFGVVPVENSTEGVVNYTLDLLYATDLKLCGEVYLEVTHNLVSASGRREDIERVYSHPQPFAQCREWLAKNMAGVPQLEARSTAEAARKAKEDNRSAAITSLFAAQTYGLEVIEERIEDNPRNYTRFAVLGRQECERTGSDKTSLLFSTEDVPGALFSALAPFAKRGINLTKLESRPMKAQAWRYIFFVDLEGHAADEAVSETLAELGRCCRFVKLLGSYPKAHDQEKFAR